jgi:outer membrane biosynthesis protein TonB
VADTIGGPGPDSGSAPPDDVVSLEPEPTQEEPEEPEVPEEPAVPEVPEPEEPEPAVEPEVHPSLW